MINKVYELTDDKCTVANTLTSFAFELDAEPYYVFSETEPDVSETFYSLRRDMMITHWIAEFSPIPGGFYRCLIRGTDGRSQWFTFTPEAVEHNLYVVQNGMNVDGGGQSRCAVV